jgi:DNA polymerase-3 subunit gamma/tau
MSLYNKYRPKNFDQFAHGKHIISLSKESLKHHAYLFFGPSGTGKTSYARLCMAEFDKDNLDQCISGSHPDYVEINCAVNNGVDDIRAIISDVVNILPVKSQYKFIVFDESHMLTTNAMNALLKTIEEPPSHVKFIFCTTEINKVIPAIRTRCQIIPFFKITENDIYNILEYICTGEKLQFDKDSLKLIASCSEGSARSAINFLEQCTTCLSDSELVSNILGTSSQKTFYNLTKLICEKNRVESLSLLDQMFNDTMDVNNLMNKYADYLADLIIVRLKDRNACEFEGAKLIAIAQCVTEILKDFKILQNIKLISKISLLKVIEKL